MANFCEACKAVGKLAAGKFVIGGRRLCEEHSRAPQPPPPLALTPGEVERRAAAADVGKKRGRKPKAPPNPDRLTPSRIGRMGMGELLDELRRRRELIDQAIAALERIEWEKL